jgi:hypothetical protein
MDPHRLTRPNPGDGFGSGHDLHDDTMGAPAARIEVRSGRIDGPFGPFRGSLQHCPRRGRECIVDVAP